SGRERAIFGGVGGQLVNGHPEAYRTFRIQGYVRPADPDVVALVLVRCRLVTDDRCQRDARPARLGEPRMRLRERPNAVIERAAGFIERPASRKPMMCNRNGGGPPRLPPARE